MEAACSGTTGRAAARAAFTDGNDDGLLPLHLLCRYHPRAQASMQILIHAYPEAENIPINKSAKFFMQG